jgi:hypothetical protein
VFLTGIDACTHSRNPFVYVCAYMIQLFMTCGVTSASATLSPIQRLAVDHNVLLLNYLGGGLDKVSLQQQLGVCVYVCVCVCVCVVFVFVCVWQH